MRLVHLLISLFFCGAAAAGTPVGTAFTYQGELSDAGVAADGVYDFRFELYDAQTDGSLLGTVDLADVAVSDGDFSVKLNFGTMAFEGSQRWLALSVRADGEPTYTALTPRQEVTPAPYAIHADLADGAVFADTATSADSVAFADITERPRSAAELCVDSQGDAGVVLDGICVLEYDNAASATWNTASATCIARGGDLCSASQYQTLRNENPDLFHDLQPVWSRNFSDNDGGNKSSALQSSDDPSASQQYSYACCGLATPGPFRGQAETINGVQVTYLHSQEDTTWDAAAKICQARGSDLCSKSQYVALNDGGRFSASVRRATCELSDNDGGTFNSVLGSNAGDNGLMDQKWAFACCSTSRPADGSCPATPLVLANSLCAGEIHDTEDTNFFDAARACTAVGADLCSKSQMQSLRNAGLFFGASWTRNGADNDSSRVGGLLSSQPDNPDPANDLFGYACCY